MDVSLKRFDTNKEDSKSLHKIRNRIQSLVQSINRSGVHSVSYMSAAGFEYTGDGDTVRCKDCGLEVSNWTLDMKPFIIHSTCQPKCSFVCSMVPASLSNMTASSSSRIIAIRKASISNEEENPSKRRKIEIMGSESVSNTLFEVESIQQVRRRTFSHWLDRTIPSSAQMIEAGFFNCNIGDRVICIYCNLICQQWTPYIDDPCEVHKTLSPTCIYVKAKLIHPVASPIIIVNDGSTQTTSDNCSSTSMNLDPLGSNDIVFTASCNPAYSEIPKRHASFATWSNEDLPPVDDLVRAGFFYTGAKTIVTCFYCNGSIKNWHRNDSPMIEHARWFPHCAYARQLCGDDLYRNIQEFKQAKRKRTRTHELKERTSSSNMLNTNLATNSQLLLIPDESTLFRLVAARLDLPMSQRLLDQNFKLSIIKRCWEDQLRIKYADFVYEYDLYIACVILQKQIEHIDGKKENIVIPSLKMKQVREQNDICMHEKTSTISNVAQSVSNLADVEMTESFQSLRNESTSSQSSIVSTSKPTITGNECETETTKQRIDAAPSNPCVLCLEEEKRIACMPCGHLATCVACGHSLRSCPICRQEIQAFVRIYI
ncbi:unnamed protein product [Rotaria sp. Silwood2]|nr:unnamed protein product [Rotaria sp. Silwood2]CAF2634336.1 unnamed protein product [Rotaria sp. Silwood2]CAF3948960.1 unnamed protein product [Rotaria sp. Silwood2]CAF4249962.1 unnamed protein product [Rotaria sp. Silwood2]